jgi:NitT/TauT family transport system permease protein
VTEGRLPALLTHAAPGIALIAILAVWELTCRLFAIPSFILPSPSAIAVAGFHVGAGDWATHFWATFKVTLIGFAVSIAVGLPLAMVLALSPLLSRTIYPILVIIQSTPIVAIAPIIVVTLGANDLPKIVITFIIAFFPIVISTATGLLSTPLELIELSRSLRGGRRREILHIRTPYATGHIFSGLRVAVTLAVIGAVVAELVAADQGLGYFISISTSLFKMPQAFAALFVLIAMSLGLFYGVGLVQSLLFPWSLPRKTRP